MENLGRNIIRKLVVKLEGNEIISTDDYDILYSFYDCWKTATERRNAIFQGIVEAEGQTENAIKHRINAGDKANNAKDQTVASIYDNRFCIPLDFEILESSLPLYQYGLGSRLTYELTFADYSDVIKSTDPDATYTISNISLEFDTITNASLASQIRTEYVKSSILYDRILRVFIVCDVEGKLNEWIRLFKSALKGHQTLFIIDDCSAEGEINKKRDALSELALTGRHRNHSLWVLTQKYNSVSKDVREQIKWLCLFFTKDRDSFEDCLRENDVIPDKNERNRLKKCLQDRPYSKLILKCYQPTGYHLL